MLEDKLVEVRIARIEQMISNYVVQKYLSDEDVEVTDELIQTIKADLRDKVSTGLAGVGITDPIEVDIQIDPMTGTMHSTINFVKGLTNPDATPEENKPAEEQYIDGATAAYREWKAADSNSEVGNTKCLHGVSYDEDCEVCEEPDECDHGNPWDDCKECSEGK